MSKRLSPELLEKKTKTFHEEPTVVICAPPHARSQERNLYF